jgi:hypothetical protein
MSIPRVFSGKLFLVLLLFPLVAKADTTTLQFGSVSASTYICTSAFQGYFGNNFVTQSSISSSPPFTALEVEPGELGYSGKPTICVQFNASSPGTYSGWVRTTWTSQYGDQYEADVYSTGTWVASPVTGYINPKYVILGVTYAPPGPSSNVTYTNSNFVGNTTTTTDSFQSDVNLTVSVTKDIKAWSIVGGAAVSVTGSESTDYIQGSNSSSTTTISKQTSVSDKTNGTGDAFNPVNHDYDTIWLWLNPLLIYTLDPNNPNSLQWNGYGYDSNDPSGTGGPDVFPVQVGWLNGHFGNSPSIQAVLARSWVTTNEPGMTWPSGEGPGLTSTDIATILQADPFASGTYTLPSPLPSTTADQRFTQIAYPPNPIAYTQAGPGNGGGITTTYNTVYTNTSSVASGASQSFKQAFGIDSKFSGGTWFAKFTLDIKQSNTLTWTHTWQTTLTTTQTLTDALSITGPGCPQTSPPCTPLYTGPGQFIVFQDNLFGTFMFYPSN